MRFPFQKDPPRIYLGRLAVVPRSALKRLLEDASGWFKPEKLEDEIEAALRDLFALPPLASRESPRDSDLLLDVMVPTVQRGSTLAVQFGSFPLSVFWRPKVTVAARHYVISRPRVMLWLRRGFAGAFAALGLRLALAER